MPQVKAVPAQVKAAADGEPDGTFSAIVAAYNTDSGGDRIIPGAFSKSLARWKESGNPIPFVWAHQHTDPFAHVGGITEAAETDDGLVVKGRLDIEDNPTAKQVYTLIKGGRINNYSFAYDVNDSEQAKSDDESGATTLLKELEIFEAGPCLVGMNRDTRTLAIKSDTGVKASVSDTPWSNFSTSDYTDEQYARACILDRGPDAGTAKQRYSLPVREPSGTVNRNACHAAAAVLGGGRGGVNATAEQKRAAAKKLLALYRGPLGDEPPESLVNAAKAGEVMGKSVPGSFEARQDAIWAALDDGSGDSWACPIATFSDSVVYRMSGSNEGTYRAPYTIDADGNVTIGDPEPVEVTENIVPAPKSGAVGTKVGRTLSAANLTAIRKALQSIQDGVESLESITGVVDDDDAQESGKAHAGEPVKSDEDPKAKAEAEEPDGKSEDTHAPEPADPVLKSQSELSAIELEFLTI